MASGGVPQNIKPSCVPYFFGRITRDEAEIVLTDRGLSEGMFLLRESISPLGNYAISLCHDNKIHHYAIEKQLDGSYMIPTGKRFAGPVELIEHHKQMKDGVITLLTFPCERQPGQFPVAFRGMTYVDLEQELFQKAKSIKGVRMDKALGSQREHLVIMVAKDLHVKQPWYHGKIDRIEAEKRLKQSAGGHKDGKFLVRAREDKKTYAVGISYKQDTRHYLIDRSPDNKFGIQDGPKFDCVMMLVDHYHNKQDGLLCKLTEPCPNNGFDRAQLKRYMSCNCGNLEYLRIGQVNHGMTRASTISQATPTTTLQNTNTPPPVPPVDRRPSLLKSSRRKLPPIPDERLLGNGNWEGSTQAATSVGFDSRRVTLQRLGFDAEGLEDIYGSVPRTEDYFAMQKSQIELQDTLGAGQFGSVCKGMATLRDGKKIPVAVKTLKNEECDPFNEPALITEAKLMMPLSHKHIVRMIGFCKAESIMLVLELAPLGQLNTFLMQHKDMSQANILELLWQVAKGMEYLESMKFVHRDLAARNVLLVSEHFAKISDFGMSKALARDNNYYEAKEAGKWPLKWYAPECVYYWKFDSKSDVWSYGVTMWEATSYGERPYRKMKGQEILHFIVEEDKRLAKPEYCHAEVYDIMLRCWEYEKCARPSFADLVTIMKRLHDKLKDEIFQDYIRKSMCIE